MLSGFHFGKPLLNAFSDCLIRLYTDQLFVTGLICATLFSYNLDVALSGGIFLQSENEIKEIRKLYKKYDIYVVFLQGCVVLPK